MKYKLLVEKIYSNKLLNPYLNRLEKELKDCNSILDVGCGRDSVLKFINVNYKVGVDCFRPYIEESRRKKIHHEYILSNILDLDIAQKSFDAVVALNVIEHVEKREGLKLIENMNNWAKKKIIIFTPNGFLKQAEYDGNILQIHKSGWTVDEFKELGFKSRGMNGFKFLQKYNIGLKTKFNLFLLVLAKLTERIPIYFPNSAFQLIAIKKIK